MVVLPTATHLYDRDVSVPLLESPDVGNNFEGLVVVVVAYTSVQQLRQLQDLQKGAAR